MSKVADIRFIAKPYKQGKDDKPNPGKIGWRVYDPNNASYPIHRPDFPYEELGIDREAGLPFYAFEADCLEMATALTMHFQPKGKIKDAPKASKFEETMDAMAESIQEALL